MQTKQVIEGTSERELIKPLDIITMYDEYDLGENPYNIRAESKKVLYVADTVYNALEDRSIENSQSKERKNFLQAVANEEFDFILSVQNSLLEYLLQNAENEEFKEVFSQNKLRFVRFFTDLPKENVILLMKPLFDDDNYNHRKNNFIEWVAKDLYKNDVPALALTTLIFRLDDIVKGHELKNCETYMY